MFGLILVLSLLLAAAVGLEQRLLSITSLATSSMTSRTDAAWPSTVRFFMRHSSAFLPDRLPY